MLSHLRHVLSIVATSILLLTSLTLPADASPPATYNNSLILQRADPFILKHTDGFYYFTATVPAFDAIILRRAPTISALSTAPETTIWRRKSSGTGSGQVWAPELHYIDSKWYIYVALGVSSSWKIRASILEGIGANPLTATWTEKALPMKTNWDTFSLDMTTFVSSNGTRYAVWAQQEPTRTDENSSLMIAPLQNPWTIKGQAVAISRPTLSWERIGYKVNEGPSVIQRGGRIYLTYSASATDYNYCMGLLSAPATADLLNPTSWTKQSTPVFTSNADTNQWGPGHNSFTVSEDGGSVVMVYHDRGYKEIKGDPLNDPNRRTRVQKVYWRRDGTPDFGIPVPEGVTPVRLRVDGAAGGETAAGVYVRYVAGSGGGGASGGKQQEASLAETLFRTVSPGLSGVAGTVSIESTVKPGQFLRRGSNNQLRFEARVNSAAFGAEASFIQRDGLVVPASDKPEDRGVSFEATDVQRKGWYVQLGEDGVSLSLAEVRVGTGDVKDEVMRARATFYLE